MFKWVPNGYPIRVSGIKIDTPFDMVWWNQTGSLAVRCSGLIYAIVPVLFRGILLNKSANSCCIGKAIAFPKSVIFSRPLMNKKLSGFTLR